MSKNLYPNIKPYHTEWLAVSDLHQLYIEQSGNEKGIPVIYLHGGPGAGSSDDYRRYFDPEKYRIVLFDQRGSGRSIPSPSTEENTTWDLVNDMEKIRQHLNIETWLVAGGSWGTTLALCYGISHRQKVKGFILRGVFLGSQEEYDWLYQPNGAASFFPEYYNQFISLLPIEDRIDVLAGYQKLLTSDNDIAVTAACKAWYLWELRLSSIEHHHVDKAQIHDNHQVLCMAKISSHFFNNHCDLSPNYILDNIHRVADIPVVILHGRYDMVCQLKQAYRLEQAWQNSCLQIMPQAGHSGFELQTIDAFCKATDTMANFLNEQKIT